MHLPNGGIPSEGPAVVIDVQGELDLLNASELRARIDVEIVSAQAVVVDLTKVTFVDSTGLGALIAARNDARRMGCALWVRLPFERAARMPFELTGLDELFTRDDNSAA
jgi:anti-sigma B factor antagonist